MKIDIMNLIRIKALLSKNFHIQPSEVDKMPMWEYELYVKQLNALVEEENERHKSEEEGYNKYKKFADPKHLQRNTQQTIQTPKMPNINFPKPSW